MNFGRNVVKTDVNAGKYHEFGLKCLKKLMQIPVNIMNVG
jgi:hypothetical protein